MEFNSSYSVALCTYNGEKYIEEQLRSILTQTIPPKEIIVSDDGSKDQTLNIVNDILKDSVIKYRIVKNIGMHGVTANFCNAISLCSEEIIFTADQDDVWVNNKAETILKIFNENMKALLVFTDGELVDQKLKSLNCSIWKSVGITDEMVESDTWFEYMLNRCLVTGATMALKKELFSTDEEIPYCWLHDGWLAWKAVTRGGLIPCKEKLILYRQHGDNVVGMNRVTSMTRVKSYFVNFKFIRDTHIIRYNRYMELKKNMGYMFSNKEQEELDNCILFWKDLIESDRISNRFARINIIIRHIKQGDFEKFFNGKKGAIREILVAIRY